MIMDPFNVIQKALKGVKKFSFPSKMVAVDYDDGADVLYVKFRHMKVVDNKSLDEAGLVLASLDWKGQVAGLTIMESSRFARVL